MSDLHSEPMADWPADLRAHWDDLATRCPLDPANPAESLLQTLRQAGAELERQLAALAAARADLQRTWAVVQTTNPTAVRSVVCRECGAGNLTHFYTSKRQGDTLCAHCFQGRAERGLARERGPAPNAT